MHPNKAQERLGSLMLPGTPERVRHQYLTLARRAEETSFGLLEEDVVMLDTETTGLSFRKNELIEIAAARISGREVVERFRTFVHPTGPIPQEIKELTGIQDLDVMDAPSPIEAVAALADFVAGQPVVAHNAMFDRSFIERVDGGCDVTDVWIDSLSLSRIALPCLKSHRLADMAEAFGCDAVTHRAMDDVDALCGIWRILLLGLSDLPAGLLDRLAGMHEDVPWSLRPILGHIAREWYGASFSLRDIRRELVARRDEQRRSDYFELAGDVDVPMREQIDEAFGPEGTLTRMYESYERRPEQIAMSQEVRDSLEEGSFRAIEAGTGVGKSMAYLVPEILFAQQNGITVGVATKTNALTDQLISHELPALSAVLPNGVSFCSIKGYDHYPCLRRLELAMVRELPANRGFEAPEAEYESAEDMLTAMAVVSAYAAQMPEGDLDALGIRWRAVPRDMLTTRSSECLRSRCPFFPHECMVHGARRRAACSDVVVTNHALLLRDIALDNAILPPIRHWVVDEAHGFEQEARRQWAYELSSEATTSVFAQLGGVDTGVIHSIITQAGKLDASTLVSGLMVKAAAAVQRASVLSADFLTSLHGLATLAPHGGGYESVTLWVDEHIRASEEWATLESIGSTLAASLDEVEKQLSAAHDALVPESAVMAAELADLVRRVHELSNALRIIVLEPDSSYVYSAELFKSAKRRGRERLVAEKLDVGADLSQRWYPELSGLVYTSATIAVGESFEHFEHAVGFDRLESTQHKHVRLDSSFDYDSHMSAVLVRDMPAPNDRAYLSELEQLLFDIHTRMGGSVLTLFTNRREMEQVFRSLQPRLSTHGLKLLCQERGASPRRLRERFMSEESVSLFALKSFWEGFDATGDTLRCVVIPKLPFASPHDPLVRERDVREPRAWWRYSLPEAVLSVKQAAGRLIRSSTDTGILVLADSRLVTKRYGRTFVNALPSHNCITLERANVGRYISMWQGSHKR